MSFYCPGRPNVGKEVLRHQPEHHHQGGDRQLPGVHPVPQDPGQRAHEGSPPPGPGPLQHHHERAGLSGV